MARTSSVKPVKATKTTKATKATKHPKAPQPKTPNNMEKFPTIYPDWMKKTKKHGPTPAATPKSTGKSPGGTRMPSAATTTTTTGGPKSATPTTGKATSDMYTAQPIGTPKPVSTSTKPADVTAQTHTQTPGKGKRKANYIR